MKALSEHSMIRPAGFGSPGRLGQATGKTPQSKEYVLTYVGARDGRSLHKTHHFQGKFSCEILRLRDVGEVELGPQVFDIYSTSTAIPRLSSFSR